MYIVIQFDLRLASGSLDAALVAMEGQFERNTRCPQPVGAESTRRRRRALGEAENGQVEADALGGGTRADRGCAAIAVAKMEKAA